MMNLSLFIVAARYKLYVAVAMAAFTSIYGSRLPAEAPEAADAIAWAVLQAPSELPQELQGVSLAATMAIYAAKETDVRKHPCKGRRDAVCADGGLAGGFWQLHQPAGFAEDARTQAQAWVELIRQSSRICNRDSTAALAMTLSGHCGKGRQQTRSRLLLVSRALSAWNASQAERPTEARAESAPPAAAVPATAEPTAAGGAADAPRAPAGTLE